MTFINYNNNNTINKNTAVNINYCVRGGHKPARWPWPTSRLTEMEK